MSEQNVPAWKRAGLQVKESKANDKVSTTQAPSKRKAMGNEDEQAQEKDKKPPKRPRLPMAERKARRAAVALASERDQLAYLREYHEDRSKWKFSKQKQNWLLRHAYQIDNEYHEALLEYLHGLQGGSRQRVEDQARELVRRWNEFMTAEDEPEAETGPGAETETKTEAGQLQEQDTADNDKPNTTPSGGEQPSSTNEKEESGTSPDQTKTKPEPVDEKTALLAQKIVQRLSGEVLKLKLVDMDISAAAPPTAETGEIVKGAEETVDTAMPVVEETTKEDKKQKEDKKEKKQKEDKKDKKDKKEKKEKKDKEEKKDKKEKKEKEKKEKEKKDKKEKKEKKDKKEKKSKH